MANAFVHLELNTTDPAKAREFYSQVFDWKLEDVPMGEHGTYTLIKPGKEPNGGMMKHPMPGAPSAWLVYVGVDDVHASTKKAVSHGAKLLKEATEIPGVGWFSVVMDPTGAAFAMFQPKM